MLRIRMMGQGQNQACNLGISEGTREKTESIGVKLLKINESQLGLAKRRGKGRSL